MKALLKQFEEKQPEIVFHWKDHETEAEGWIVINSLRGGAAGGGTRMRLGLDQREVESLAKTLEIKFTVSGPAIGGAKSGINFDPSDPRKQGVLQRWFKAVTPLLKSYYGTGGDLNINEITEVIPLTEQLGLWHPQEGVLNGHFQVRENERIHQIGQLRMGVSKVLEDPLYAPNTSEKLKVADMITGFGVAESVRHYYHLFHSGHQGKRAIIQGWGNVAAAAGYYLSQMGVQIVGILDKDTGIIAPEGLSTQDVLHLFKSRQGNRLQAEGLLPYAEVQERFWDLPADIFIPAAASRLVSKPHVARLVDAGVELIASGANVPFADREIFYGPVMEYADQKLSLIPDFIANCGMARVFAYLMQKNVELSDQAIFEDVSQVIYAALKNMHQASDQATGIASRAYQIALSQLLD